VGAAGALRDRLARGVSVIALTKETLGNEFMNTPNSASKKWKVIIPVIIIVLVAGWYWFRPERLVTNRRVDEPFPTMNDSSTQILESGNFHSGTHPTEGTATIYRIENGSRVLRFTNFKTSNGPDVHIYMVATEDAKDSANVQHAAFVDLGLIKGNIGDQNYILGSDLDLAKYRTVSVWCKRFSKNFGAAPLMPAAQSTR
jgi:hypothetical protein